MPECRRLTNEAVLILEQARELASGESEIMDLAQGARAELTRLEQVERNMEEARRLIDLNTVSARQQARDVLRGLREYDQDTTYLQLLTALRRQYLNEAGSSLRQGQLDAADDGLMTAKEDLFRVLNGSDEIEQIESKVTSARRGPWLRALGWTVGIVLVVSLAFVGFNRFGGMALLAPTATLAPTALCPNTDGNPIPTFAATAVPTRPDPTRTLTQHPNDPNACAVVWSGQRRFLGRILPNGGSWGIN